MEHPRKPWRRLPKQSHVFFFLVLGLMVYLSWLIFEDFLIYIITGVFLAVIALPIDKFWERFFPNRVAAGFTMLTLFLIVTVPLLLLGVAMYNDVSELAGALEQKSLEGLVNRTVERPLTRDALGWVYPDQNETELKASLNGAVEDSKAQIIVWLQNLATDMIQAIPDIMIGTTVVLFVVYYVLVDGERLVAYTRRAAPLPSRQIDYLLRETRLGLNAVFLGQILVCILQGVAGGIGFALVGLPNPVLWGAVMALLALLPVVGTNLVWIPAGIWLIIEGNLWGGVFEIAWGAIVVMFLMDNVVKPKLIGSQTDIHPMLVLVGVLGGATVFGFIGLFLGPLLVGVTVAMLNVFEADYLDPDINLIDEHEVPVSAAHPPKDPPAA